MNRWDLFISHASEDKASLVKPLASELMQFGLKVWYDEYELKIGDSLSRSIDKGLSLSDHGLVVISPSFIAKKWPDYELRGLNAKEISGEGSILPIWHKITNHDVIKFSPTLADKKAINTDGLSITKVAILIIEIVRPDIFTRIIRRLAHIQASKTAVRSTVDLRTVKQSPVRHQELPAHLVGRIRLIRAAFIGPYAHSMEYWLDGFKRDAHPSREIAIWEHMASVYLEFLALHPSLDAAQKGAVFSILTSLGLGVDDIESKISSDRLPPGSIEKIERMYSFATPPFDIDEKNESFKNDSDAPSSGRTSFDIENFPIDVPDHLLRPLTDKP